MVAFRSLEQSQLARKPATGSLGTLLALERKQWLCFVRSHESGEGRSTKVLLPRTALRLYFWRSSRYFRVTSSAFIAGLRNSAHPPQDNFKAKALNGSFSEKARVGDSICSGETTPKLKYRKKGVFLSMCQRLGMRRGKTKDRPA